MRKRIYAAGVILCFSSMLTAQQPVAVTDGTNGNVAVKAARTAPTIADKAHVVALSPNNLGLPVNLPAVVQSSVNVTLSGTTVDISITPSIGNTLVALCGVNNTGTIAASDTGALETWTTAKSQTGTTAGSLISYAVVASASAHTVRCTAGTTGVVGGFVYEVSGLLQQVAGLVDATDSNATGFSVTAAPLSAGLVADSSNEMAFAAPFLTTNTTCTAVAPWTADTQQGFPGGRLCPMHLALADTDKITGNVVTFSSASYAMAVATFRPPVLGIEGTVQLFDGTTKAGIIAGTTALKTDLSSVAGTATATAAAGIQKVGVTDGSGNGITSNSSTFSSKFGLDGNLLGTLGTAFSTAGKIDVKAASGDLNDNLAQVGGSTVSTAATGIQKVGIVGNAGAVVDVVNNAAPPANALAVGFETATQTTTQPTASTAGNMRFGLARTDGTLYVAPHGPVIWSCGLNAIAATLTQCQAAPAGSLRLYITDVISQSNTSTAGLFTLRFGTGTNCGTGTGNLMFGSASALMASPANTSPVNHFHLTVPIAVTAANAVCVLGVATNTTNIEINGYTAP